MENEKSREKNVRMIWRQHLGYILEKKIHEHFLQKIPEELLEKFCEGLWEEPGRPLEEIL